MCINVTFNKMAVDGARFYAIQILKSINFYLYWASDWGTEAKPAVRAEEVRAAALR